jgi:hypothetical protein
VEAGMSMTVHEIEPMVKEATDKREYNLASLLSFYQAAKCVGIEGELLDVVDKFLVESMDYREWLRKS